jgi:hypothetical protein
VEIPKAKAIGTPSATASPTIPTKKITRLKLPMPASNGRAIHSAVPIASTAANAVTASKSFARSMRRATTITSINTAPTPIAATRQPSLISSAGVVMNDCNSTYSRAGGIIARRNAATTVVPKVSSQVRQRGGASDTRKASRMCSARRSAMTEPSMASHRNRADASSSDQVIGELNT